MEPYRPVVDTVVRQIIHETSVIDPMTREQKNKLLAIPTHDVLIDGERSPLMIATQRTASSLAKCFLGDSKKILYPALI